VETTVKEHTSAHAAVTLSGRLLQVPEVARRLSVPESTVYDMARQNRIGGVVRVGRRVRFDPIELERWIRSGGQALPGGWRREPQE
jgi:excisionase family DNA binding protein